MPTYGFKCRTCGSDFDVRRSVAARDEPEECPTCGDWAERRFWPQAIAFNIDHLRAAGFFNCTRSDFEPDEKTQPELFQLEDRKFSLAGGGRAGNVSRTSYAEALAVEKSWENRPAEKPAGPPLETLIGETFEEMTR